MLGLVIKISNDEPKVIRHYQRQKKFNTGSDPTSKCRIRQVVDSLREILGISFETDVDISESVITTSFPNQEITTEKRRTHQQTESHRLLKFASVC